MKKVLFKVAVVFVTIIALLLVYSFEPAENQLELREKYQYPDSKFIDVDGLEVHYRKTGQGPYLVLLHGVASSLHTWEGWHDELSDNFTVVSIDVPAFGLTGPFPDNDYSFDHYMFFLDDLLDALEIESCFMAGNSFGGGLTWQYALFSPERVRKIILLDAGGFPRNVKDADLGFFLCKSKGTAWFTHLFTPKALVKKSVYNAYKKDELITDETVQRYFDLMLHPGNREAFTQVLRNLGTITDTDEQLQKLRTPTLIIWGDDDQIIPVEYAEKFEKNLLVDEVIIYDSGHIPMEEDPEITAKDALRFLMMKKHVP